MQWEAAVAGFEHFQKENSKQKQNFGFCQTKIFTQNFNCSTKILLALSQNLLIIDTTN